MNGNGPSRAGVDSSSAGPAVTVVMAAYNAAPFLQEAVDSLLAQRFGDWELIVVDDGSTDATPQLLQDYGHRDARIRSLRQSNQGQSVARNRALSESRGEFIAFLDADDRWEPAKLELQIPRFQGPEVGLVFTAVQDIDAAGRCIRGPENWELHRGWILDRLLRNNFICCSSVVVRKSVLETHRLRFAEGRVCEDWLLWCQVCRVAKADCVDAPLVHYRVHPQGTSRNQARMIAGEMACRRDLLAMLRSTSSLPGQDLRGLRRGARLELHRAAYHFARQALREGDAKAARGHWEEAWRSAPWKIGRIWRMIRLRLQLLFHSVRRTTVD